MNRNPLKPLAELLATPLPYWLGVRHFKKQRWAQADACFEEAIRRSPEHARSYFKRGQIAMKAKKWEAAYLLIEKALFLDPWRAAWLTQYRQVLRRLDAPPVPGNEFTEALLRERIADCGNSTFLYSLLARELRSRRKWWLELDALEAAVKLDDSDVELHFRHGRALEGMGRIGEALVSYTRAVDLGSPDPQSYYRLGLCLWHGDCDLPPDHEKALSYFGKAVEKEPDEELKRLGIGVFHQNEGQWDLAAEAYRLALEDAPENEELHFRLGMCHDRCYQWAAAEECYARAIGMNDGEPYWHFRLGFVLERQRKFAEAAASYAIAAKADDKRSPAWSFRMGYVLEKLGRHEEACRAYLVSLPRSKQMQAQADVSGESSEDLERILATDATDAARWARLAAAREESGMWSDAADCYQQAIARAIQHEPRWQIRAGYCQMMLGHYREACGLLRDSRILQRPQGVSEAEFRQDPELRKVVSYTEYYDTLEIRETTALYESFHGKVMSCNPYALFRHLLSRPDFKDWTHVWALEDMSKIPSEFRSMKNVIFVVRDSDAYMRYLASARLLVNNVSFSGYFTRKEGQIYLNTWHGTPWKMMGKDIRGEFLVYGNVARNFLQATHIINPNRYTTDILLEKYDVKTLYRGVVAETGYPRIDLTLNATDASKAALRRRLGIAGTGKVILYAPTWRGTHGNPQAESDEVMREIACLESTGHQVLFRGHTLSLKRADDINVPEDIPTNELLSIVDVLVTDYSSIWFDFIATGRPVVFYLKDIEAYSNERGLYFGTGELPGPVCHRLDELAPAVSGVADQTSGERHPCYDAAVRKFCPFEDGNASARVIDLVFSPQAPAHGEPRRKSVLMFGGGMLNSGITSSLLNLLGSLAGSDVDVTLALEPNIILDDENRVANTRRIPASVGVFPRKGPINTTLEEKALRYRVRKISRMMDHPEVEAIYKTTYQREFRRLFGESRFDVAMDFEGYNSFWMSVIGCAPAASVGTRTAYQHNDMVAEWKTRFPQLEMVFRLYRFYDRLISVSKMTMERNIEGLSKDFRVPVSKFDHAENMLDPGQILSKAAEPPEPDDERRFFGAGGPVFINVGRLSIEKDHAKLIRAFSMVRKSHKQAKLLIVGDGPLMLDLRKLVEEMKLETSVFLTGFRANPFTYIARADCFVLSSNHEGQPMVLLEAMVLNKPIISTDITGARGVLQGRSGLLVENSEAGLADGMRDFINGEVPATPFDTAAYQANALDSFRRKSCGFVAAP